MVRCRCGHGCSVGPRDTAWRRELSPVAMFWRGQGAHRRPRHTRSVEGRWVKKGRLEIVLNEPLAFYAATPRPRPRGWVSDHEAHDHHTSAAAQPHLVADREFHAGFYIGS